MHGPTGIFWANLLVTPFSIKGKLNGTDVYVMSFDFRDPRWAAGTTTCGAEPRPAELAGAGHVRLRDAARRRARRCGAAVR